MQLSLLSFNITSFDNEINALECLRHHSKLLKWFSFQQQNFASRIAKMFRRINYVIFQIVALLDNKLPDQTDLVLHQMPYHTESNLHQMPWVCPGRGSALLDLRHRGRKPCIKLCFFFFKVSICTYFCSLLVFPDLHFKKG